VPEYGQPEYQADEGAIRYETRTSRTDPLVLAGRIDRHGVIVDHFNGKLEAPALLSGFSAAARL
jgi:hypothetical protein